MRCLKSEFLVTFSSLDDTEAGADAASHRLTQTPVLKYNHQLMQAILWDKLPIAKIVNVKVIKLNQAPEGYKNFDAGAANKFVIDPHGLLSEAS